MHDVLIIYSSTDGHTKNICERISNLLNKKNETKIISLDDVNKFNLSSFNKLQFRLNLKNPQKVNLKFKYDVNMYVNYYNIIEYNNGVGAIKYAN